MSENKDIQNELSHISPLLAKLTNKDVYDMPETRKDHDTFGIMLSAEKKDPALELPSDYFEALPHLIMNKIHGEAADPIEIETGFVRNNPYEIESDYFENFTPQITLQNEKSKVISFRKIALYSGIAACVISLLGLIIMNIHVNNNINTSSQPNQVAIVDVNHIDEALDQIETSDMIAYLEEQGHDVDAALLACAEEHDDAPDDVDIMSDDENANYFLNESEKKINSPANTYELF